MLSGLILGVWFDVYRILVRELQLSRWVLPFLDLCYWLLATLFVFRTLLEFNFGEIRLYIFLGLLLGISIYFAFFSQLVIKGILLLMKWLGQLMALLLRLFEVLIVRPTNVIIRFIVILYGFLVALTIFLGKIVLQLFYPVWAVLKWLTNPLRRHLGFLHTWGRALARVTNKFIGLLRRNKS